MSATPVDLAHLQQWVGRSESREQHLDPFPARALAGLLDREQAYGDGDALPLPWHWLYFLDAPSREGTGADGHPKRGGFLPPVPLPRRMWAAGELTLHEPLRLGRVARKTSTVRSVELKQGKAGALVFVTVAHELAQDGHRCISELQHIVYREAPTAPAPLPPGEPAPTDATWQRAVRPDPVNASLSIRARHSAPPVSPRPVTTCSTSRPCTTSRKLSASHSPTPGVYSLGLNTTALPAARAYAMDPIGVKTG